MKSKPTFHRRSVIVRKTYDNQYRHQPYERNFNARREENDGKTYINENTPNRFLTQ